jgi:hypothetical protein
MWVEGSTVVLSGSGVQVVKVTSTTATVRDPYAADQNIGYREVPVLSKTANYTLALTDAGRVVSITTGGVVIPANGSVAFPIGTAISVYNDSGSTQSITITTDTLRLGGTASTGTRTLQARGLATLLKVAATEWVATGHVT